MGALSVTAPGVFDAAPGDRDARAAALHAGARPLVALATQLRRAVPDAPEEMKRALVAAVARFERELGEAGWDERGIAAASYLLSAWVDEVVAHTPWGEGGAGLLERFHGEHMGSDRVLRLLSRLAEQPRENRALLELFHACLSLGLTGHLGAAPEAQAQLERLRARVFAALPHEPVALSPPWSSAVRAEAPPWRRRLALGALLLLGLLALGVYTASHLLLAARVDGVFASMRRLADSAAPAPAAARPAVARLAPLLAADAVTVRDEASRSIVVLPEERLFEAGSTQPSARGEALLARIAEVLRQHDGKVLVVGHTDGSDARSARLPSAWHQSFQWARASADVLARTLAPQRLAVEGAADAEEPGDAGLPRRRVDIVLYP